MPRSTMRDSRGKVRGRSERVDREGRRELMGRDDAHHGWLLATQEEKNSGGGAREIKR